MSALQFGEREVKNGAFVVLFYQPAPWDPSRATTDRKTTVTEPGMFSLAEKPDFKSSLPPGFSSSSSVSRRKDSEVPHKRRLFHGRRRMKVGKT